MKWRVSDVGDERILRWKKYELKDYDERYERWIWHENVVGKKEL